MNDRDRIIWGGIQKVYTYQSFKNGDKPTGGFYKDNYFKYFL